MATLMWVLPTRQLVPTDRYCRLNTAANTGMTLIDQRGTLVYQRRHDTTAKFTRCASEKAVWPETRAFKSAFFLQIVPPLDHFAQSLDHRLHPVVSLTSAYLRRSYCDKTIKIVPARLIHAKGRMPRNYAVVADTLVAKVGVLNEPKQFIEVNGFGDVMIETGCQCLCPVVDAVVARECYQQGMSVATFFLTDCASNFVTVHPRKANVAKHDLRLLHCVFLQRAGAIQCNLNLIARYFQQH